MFRNILNNQGIGLVAAIFVISIMAMFGLLIARYVSTGTTSSMDDYQWTQALYSAETGAKLRILFRDGGGNWGGVWNDPSVASFTTSRNTDVFGGAGTPATLTTLATHPTLNISRAITIKYIL
jgi:hypothetical protein